MKVTLLFLLVSLIIGVPLVSLPVSCEEFYVSSTPPPNSDCPDGEPCQTLSYYASNLSLFDNKNNISLLFLDGIHTLVVNETDMLKINNITYLLLSGVNTSYNIDHPQVLIHIHGFVMISNVFILEMVNISIGQSDSGTMIKLDNVHYFISSQIVIRNSIVMASSNTVLLDRSKFIGIGFHFTFIQSVLESGVWRRLQISTCLIESSLLEISPPPNNSTFEVDVHNTILTGITNIIILVSESQAQVTFRDCTIANATAQGGLLIAINKGHVQVSLKNCSIMNVLGSLLFFVENSDSLLDLELIDSKLNTVSRFQDDGPGIHLNIASGKANVTIVNCIFNNSHFPGFHVAVNGTYDLNMSVYDSCFTNFDMFIQDLERERNRKISLFLTNVSFSDNTVKPSLTASGPADVTIKDCLFDSNKGLVSTVYVHSVNLFFVGTSTFSNNFGSTGGSFYLSQSTLWLENGTSLFFINNTAHSGGAIYVEESRTQNFFNELIGNTPLDYESKLPVKCFYQLVFEITSAESVQGSLPIIYFKNNSAIAGGDDIYGASLKDDCTISPNNKTRSYEVANQIFQFQSQKSSQVSSQPKKVCLCDEEVQMPKCADKTYFTKQIKISPGEKFNISVVLVGSDFGPVTGGVFAIASNQDDRSTGSFTLGAGQSLQQMTGKGCTNLEYSVHTDFIVGSETTIILSRDSVTASLQSLILANPVDSDSWINGEIYRYLQYDVIGKLLSYFPVLIHVTVNPCPIGLALSKQHPFACHCEDFLIDCKYVHSCTVINGTGLLYKSGTSWVGSDINETNQVNRSICAHLTCPFDYCKRDGVIDLSLPDNQCAFNRSGVLCGGCSGNFSLALGSTKCLACSNDSGHIALVVFFIVAGIMLVFFIKILDLTVARGTINGLIFYANIIWINQSLFFPSENVPVCGNFDVVIHFMYALRVFVAWLNLDFGFEVCFYNGLDAYWKTWLQFIFPFYIWLIAGVIIVVCRYSARVTRMFGNNIVSVLATLFLLSYLKLLRTIISVLGFAVIEQYHPEGTKVVWLLDGNVHYLGLCHSFLFIAALLVFLFLWLPYTASLLFVPLLRKLPNNCLSQLINKFKPFFDAYYGPLKDKNHFWIGITLVTRTILAVVFAATQSVDPSTNFLLITIVCALLIPVALSAYKKLYNLVLEVLFLLNLVMVSAAYLRVSTDAIESQMAITCISITIALAMFVMIVLFHSYMEIRNCPRQRDRWGYENLDQSMGAGQHLVTTSPTKPVVGYREPLLGTSN